VSAKIFRYANFPSDKMSSFNDLYARRFDISKSIKLEFHSLAAFDEEKFPNVQKFCKVTN